MTADAWDVLGHDVFAGEWYVVGSYPTAAAAYAAAAAYLVELERTQPTAHSGGQADGGIQDRVYLRHPDGAHERIMQREGEAPIP